MVEVKDFSFGPAKACGDGQWYVGHFKQGNCYSWNSFYTRSEAELWLQNPPSSALRREQFTAS